MKKVHIAPKDKSFIAQRSSAEVSLVRAVSLGAVMATLLSSVSPVFASHLSSTESTVQSVSAGVVSVKAGSGRVSGRAGVANGGRSCGVDQVISRSSSRSGKKISAKEQYKKLTSNQLSDGSGDYSFESSCGADASVNALTSTRARFSIDVDAAASDWLLEENNIINWSVNTRSVNTTGARVAGGQTRELPGAIVPAVFRCSQDFFHYRYSLCIGVNNYLNTDNSSIAADEGILLGSDIRMDHIRNTGEERFGYDPRYDGINTNDTNMWWKGNKVEVVIGQTSKWYMPAIKTRQIAGISAGREDSDVINVGQLKAFQRWRNEGIFSISALQSGGVESEVYGVGLMKGLSLDGKNGIIVSAERSGIDDTLMVTMSTSMQLVRQGSIGIKKTDISLSNIGFNVGQKGVKNVAPVELSAESKDVVTGAQYDQVKEEFGGVRANTAHMEQGVKDFGVSVNALLEGGANISEGGTPIYTIQGDGRKGIEEAFKEVDNVLTGLSGKLDDFENSGVGRLMGRGESGAVTIGAKVEGTEISIANKDGGSRKLTGLAEGKVDKNSTDAITGAQLHERDKTIKGLNGTIGQVGENVTKLADNLNTALGGGANVLAGKAPTYKILGNNDEGYKGVEAAFKGVDGKLKELDEKIDGVTGTGSNALVAQDPSSHIITIGGKAEGDKISITNSKEEARTLTGLKDGELKEGSKDAVTGAQLHKMGSDISKYLGGGANVLENTPPKYTIQTKDHKDIGSAFAGVDTSLTQLSSRIGKVEENNLVAQGELQGESNVITIGKEVDGDKISLTNSKEEHRVLSGVADGDISAKSTDAVSGKQLYKLDQSVEKLKSSAEGVEGNIASFNKNLNVYLGGGADVLNGRAPTYSIQGDGHNNIASAFEGVDGKLTELKDKIGKVEENNLVKQDQDEESKLITIGKEVDGTEVSLINSKEERRVLSGVADGDISAKSTDAVSGKQLYKLDQSVEKLSSSAEGVQGNIASFDEHLNTYLGGGADVLNGRAPTYTIQTKKHNDIKSAFDGIDTSLTQLIEDVKGVTDKVNNSLVKQEGSSITIGGKVGGNEISVASSEGLRKLTGLADGKVDENSTEAVTGKQLHDVKQSAKDLTKTVSGVQKNITEFNENITKSLGGGADVLNGTAPTYMIQGDGRKGIADAFAGVDEKLAQLTVKVGQAESGLEYDGFVAQDPSSHIITIGKEVDGDKISILNNEERVRVLSGLKDGKLSAESTEAVTGNQLYQTGQTVEQLSGTVKKVEGNIASFDEHLNTYLGGGADVLKGIAPTYTIQKQGHNDIASAFDGVSSSLKELSAKAGETTLSLKARMEDEKLVAQGELQGELNVITIGKEVDGDKISLTNSKEEHRVLSGVADGDLSAKSTEAVTGNQLYKLDQSVEKLSSSAKKVEGNIASFDEHLNTYLGGGADVLNGTAPTYSIQGDGHNNIASAFEGVGEKIDDLTQKVGGTTLSLQARMEDEKLVEQDAVSKLITIGKDVEGTEVSITNSKGERRVLSGVAEGDISAKSTDVVSGKQLYKLDQSVEKLSSSAEGVQGNIASFDEHLNTYLGGGADVLNGRAPTYTIQTEDHKDIGSAFKGVDTSLTQLIEDVKGVTDKVNNSLVKQEGSSITIGGKVGGNEISVASSEGLRKLTGLADGKVDENSTEAVTGKQLHDVKQSAKDLTKTVSGVQKNITEFNENITKSLGGGADVLNGTAPTYMIQGDGRKGIADAFAGVDEKLAQLTVKVGQAESGLEYDGFVAQDPSSHIITIGKEVDGDKISILNNEERVRVLSGLKDGKLSAESTEAVTGNQLYQTGQTVEQLSGTVKKVEGNIATFDEHLNTYLGGGADVLKGIAPTYIIQKQGHNDIASAFDGVSSSLKELSAKAGETTLSLKARMEDEKLVAQGELQGELNVITIGKEVDGDKISLTNSKEEHRVLSGVADGDLSAKSTEAVTGNQLYKLDQSVEKLSSSAKKVEGNIASFDEHLNTYLGGGADVLNGTAPTYSIQGDGHNNIASAFEGVGEKIDDLTQKVGGTTLSLQARMEDEKLVEQDAVSKLITIGKDVEGTEVSITNSKGERRVLSGVAEGDISAKSTDVVSGKQLYKLDQSVEKLSSSAEGVQGNIASFDEHLNTYLGGGADVLNGRAPTYTIQTKKHNDIKSAFDGIDTSLTQLIEDVKGVTDKVNNSLVKQEGSSITIGGKVGGNEILVASSEGLRKLTGLAEGDVSDKSTEAVTGKQLHDVKQSAKDLTETVSGVQKNITEFNENITKSLGGGADVLNGTAPTYMIQGDGRKGIADAFAGVDEKLAQLTVKVGQAESGLEYDGFVAQDPSSHIITIGKEVDGDKISILNNEERVRVLSGLKDGKLSAESTEAVTGNQLYQTGQTVEQLSGTVKKVEGNIASFDEHLNTYLGGGADVLKGIAPTYTIQKQGHNDIASAFDGVSSSLKELSAKAGETTLSLKARMEDEKLVAQGELQGELNVITIGKEVDGDKISLTNSKEEHRVLSGVADGDLSAKSTEAVTGNQLYKLDQSVEKLSSSAKKVEGNIASFDEHLNTYLGGGADVLNGTAPTYSIQGDGHNNIASAFEGVGEKIDDLTQKVGGTTLSLQARMEDEKLVEQDAVSKLITIGKDVEGTEVSITNSKGERRVLSGVAEGDISAKSTDVVSGKQLYKLDQSVEKLSSSAEGVQGNIASFDEHLNTYLGGGADVLNGRAPTYTIQTEDHKDIGSAFKGVDTSLTQLIEDVKGVTDKVNNSLVKQEGSSITIGGKVGGNEISVASSEGLRKLTGLADGKVDENSTEAVTGKQLHDVKQSAKDLTKTVSGVQKNITEFNENITKSLGGGADVLNGTAPTYMIQGDGRKGIADAFAGVDEKLAQLTVKVGQAESGLEYDGFVAQDPSSHIITIGKEVDGDKISILNNEERVRVLSGLKDGKLSAESTEAVTGNQLYQTGQTVEQLSGTVKKVEGNIASFDEHLNTYLGGGADVLKGIAPTYTIQKQGHNDIASAFDGVSSSLKELSAKAGETTLSLKARMEDEKLVAQGELQGELNVITIGKEVDGDKISLTNSKEEHRVLSGVADGDLSAKSTEAVTGNQLYKLDQSVEKLSSSAKKVEGNIASFDEHLNTYLGGGADVLNGTAPTYSIQGDGHNNIASAFEGVGEKIDDLTQKVGGTTLSLQARMEDEKLVEQDAVSKLITIGKDVEGTEVSITNSKGERRVLSGVAEGDISAKSTDAVSGKQLYKLDQSVEKLSSSAEGVQGNIASFDEHLNTYLGGGADVLNGRAPTYTIQTKKHNDIKSAFDGIDTSLTQLIEDVKGVTDKVNNSLVKQEGSSITIGGKVGGNEISVASSEGLRKLTGLADGKVDENSTEAVTGKQLHDVKQSAKDLTKTVSGVQKNITEFNENITKSLGGGADVLNGTAPTYMIQGDGRKGIADAFAGVDEKLAQLTVKVGQAESGLEYDGFVAQDPSSHIITIGKEVDGDKISILNNEERVRVLSGLKDGKLSAESTEAVTGNQLYQTGQTVEQLSGTVKKVEGNIATFDEHLNTYLGGGADVLKGIAPTYIIQKQGHNDIASAFDGVSSSLKELSAKAGETTLSLKARMEDEKLVAQGELQGELNVITIGKEVDGDKISLTNSKEEHRVLSGVADGDLSAKSTEAVTGNQLYKLDQSVEKLSSSAKKVEGNIASFDEHLNTYLGGGADVLNGTAPTYSIQGDGHNNIASAFEGVGEKIDDLTQKVGGTTLSLQARMEDEKLVEQDAVSKLITIGKDVEGTEVSITNSKEERRVLSGVAEGDISAKSTDVVSGKQLYKLDQSVEKLSSSAEGVQGNIASFDEHLNTYLGGGADVLNGRAPTYTIQTKKHNDIKSAFDGIDTSLTGLADRIENVASGEASGGVAGNDLVEQNSGTDLIIIGAKTEGMEINIANNEKAPRTLSGVVEGELSAESTEAVTGNQLYQTGQTVEQLSGTVKKVEGNIASFDEHLNTYLGGGADVLKGIAPTYTIQKQGHNDIASAFDGVSSSLKELSAKAGETTLSLKARMEDEKLVAQGELQGELNVITIGKEVDGDKISLTNSKEEHRVLSGVADGDLSAKSTEAVTGNQLYKLDQSVEKLSSSAKKVEGNIASFDEHLNTYLGGGADVLNGTAPTYSIQGDGHNNIASAFEGVGEKIDDLTQKVGGTTLSLQARMEDEKLVEQDAVSKLITIGKDVEGTEVSITNSKGERRVLSGVAEGDISAKSTDAVSGKQLYKLDQSVEKLSSSAEGVQGNIASFDKNLNVYLGGGADVLNGRAPTYTIQTKKHNDIKSAFDGIDTSLTGLADRIENVASGEASGGVAGNDLVEQNSGTDLIIIGAKTEGMEINIANNEKAPRTLSGVVEGKLSAESTEAVTGKQLYEMNTTIAQYFGGGADVLNDITPTFMITNFGAQGKNGEQTYHNVADAFGAINTSMSGLNDRVQQVENQSSGSLNWNTDKGAYSASHNNQDNQPDKITNVAKEDIEEGSTNVVTGHQLWETNEKFGKVENKVDTLIGGIVTYDKDTDGSKMNSITLVGVKDGDPVLIDNVADGKIEEGSKQAVNGGQVHDYTKEQMDLVLADANKYTDEKIQNIKNIENIPNDIMTQANAYTDIKFNTLSSEVEKAQKEARQAAAINLAVSNLRYNNTAGKFSVAFSGGVWRSQSAFAFGAGYTSEDGNIRSNISATTTGGHWGIGAGLSLMLK
ncbi:YadA-like family protein [Bartonella schoenbuchensis]|uniref:YadA-like C-terminal region n=2 Tax=Bartonella schoenbuchensis (strain DSM 13525 / NCTC 13165 / R1) TaxID=687861 RepID=A0A1S6XNM8_BARSR|nr:YadA-like family protein [Bartonella schoenbuchensis]AQX30244.1 YadA-like C-terminal region [Bartonella schoenbuchensis R1]